MAVRVRAFEKCTQEAASILFFNVGIHAVKSVNFNFQREVWDLKDKQT